MNYTLLDESSFVMKTNTFNSNFQTLYVKMNEVNFGDSLVVEFKSAV